MTVAAQAEAFERPTPTGVLDELHTLLLQQSGQALLETMSDPQMTLRYRTAVNNVLNLTPVVSRCLRNHQYMAQGLVNDGLMLTDPQVVLPCLGGLSSLARKLHQIAPHAFHPIYTDLVVACYFYRFPRLSHDILFNAIPVPQPSKLGGCSALDLCIFHFYSALISIEEQEFVIAQLYLDLVLRRSTEEACNMPLLMALRHTAFPLLVLARIILALRRELIPLSRRPTAKDLQFHEGYDFQPQKSPRQDVDSGSDVESIATTTTRKLPGPYAPLLDDLVEITEVCEILFATSTLAREFTEAQTRVQQLCEELDLSILPHGAELKEALCSAVALYSLHSVGKVFAKMHLLTADDEKCADKPRTGISLRTLQVAMQAMPNSPVNPEHALRVAARYLSTSKSVVVDEARGIIEFLPNLTTTCSEEHTRDMQVLLHTLQDLVSMTEHFTQTQSL